MATQPNIICPYGEWVQLTTASVRGSILLRQGSIILTVANEKPTVDGSSSLCSWAATMSNIGEVVPYGIPATTKVWAWGLDRDGSKVSVTTYEGVA